MTITNLTECYDLFGCSMKVGDTVIYKGDGKFSSVYKGIIKTIIKEDRYAYPDIILTITSIDHYEQHRIGTDTKKLNSLNVFALTV